jgi:hypothetical protein
MDTCAVCVTSPVTGSSSVHKENNSTNRNARNANACAKIPSTCMRKASIRHKTIFKPLGPCNRSNRPIACAISSRASKKSNAPKSRRNPERTERTFSFAPKRPTTPPNAILSFQWRNRRRLLARTRVKKCPTTFLPRNAASIRLRTGRRRPSQRHKIKSNPHSVYCYCLLACSLNLLSYGNNMG